MKVVGTFSIHHLSKAEVATERARLADVFYENSRPVTYLANVKEPRSVRIGRISRKLISLSHQLPNASTAKRFLSGCLRLERIVAHTHPFRNGGVK